MSGSATPTGIPTQQSDAHAGAVYVYGIAPGAAIGEWAGDGDGSVRVIVAGELAALVRDLPPDHTPGRREDLEAHRRVLSDAIERTTVIPMRFGIVMDGDHVVRERLLEQHSDAIGDLLHRLDGHVQMTVKAFYAEDALLRDVLAEHPDLRRRSAELPALPDVQTRAARIQLGEAISAAVEARRAEIEYALAARLAPYATDIRVEPPGSERVALNAQLLVPRDRRPELDAVVRELSETLDGILAFRYVGPLPPYSFTDISLEEEEEDEQP